MLNISQQQLDLAYQPTVQHLIWEPFLATQKSSKKVSIAENLNCDYSDISSIHNEDDPDDHGHDNNHIEDTGDDDRNHDKMVGKYFLPELIGNILILAMMLLLQMITWLAHRPYFIPIFIVIVLIFKILQPQLNKEFEFSLSSFLFVHGPENNIFIDWLKSIFRS